MHCPGRHRHRVGVAEAPRLGAQLSNVLRDVHEHGDRSQAAEDPADPDRVADGLPQAISVRNLEVPQACGIAAGFQLTDHKVGAIERALTFPGDLNQCARTSLAINRPGDRRRDPEPLGIDVVEHDVQLAVQVRHGEQVRQDPAGEFDVSRADQDDLAYIGPGYLCPRADPVHIMLR